MDNDKDISSVNSTNQRAEFNLYSHTKEGNIGWAPK